MAIMATVMVKITKKHNGLLRPLTLLCPWLLVCTSLAGEWDFTPTLSIEETYTDNVELTINDQVSSLVSQAIVGLGVDYDSRMAQFNFNGNNSFVFYSHDSSLNDDYLTLSSNGNLSLWDNGPKLVGSAGISNISRNTADNSLADLVSGDTIQAEYYSAGLTYDTSTSDYSLTTSLMFNSNQYEDKIGDYDGVTATLTFLNGNAARNVFWQLNGLYSERENVETTGTHYIVEAKLGAITPYKLNPFIRFFDEDMTGTAFGSEQSTTRSWGPGLRWKMSEHLFFDVSYNYVADKTKSDDYVAANVNWQPSQRTSLIAGYNQRFFGDSYNFDFSHTTRLLTNRITYQEVIEVYDRNSYQEVELGNYWCPIGGPYNESACFPESTPPNDIENYELVPLSGLEPVEDNQFHLNKHLSWGTTLSLARTNFSFNIAAREREGLQTKVIDEHLDVVLSGTRNISPRSEFRLSVAYRENIYDKHYTSTEARQEDIYRTFSATYSKDLAHSLNSYFTLQHVNRDSNIERYTYDEVRAVANLTKEF